MTSFLSSWFALFGTLTFLIIGIFLVTPLLPTTHTDEPLADPASLKLLSAGSVLPKPPQESGGVFHGQEVLPVSLASLAKPLSVLGTSSGDKPFDITQGKRIEVDLTNQKVYAYEGDTKVYDFTVSTGKWAPTPTGQFTIWAKVRSQKMEGGNKAWGTYYYLPNVPFVMFFYNNEIAKMRGFSLHGAYWHNNFGHPMSHGCINMKIADAQVLYEWANPSVVNPNAWSTLASNENSGTKVIIYGEAPKE